MKALVGTGITTKWHVIVGRVGCKRHLRSRGGLVWRCHACRVAYFRKYRKLNRGYINELANKQYWRDVRETRAYYRKYHSGVAVKRRHKARYKKNRRWRIQQGVEWQRNHPERSRAIKKKWKASNPENTFWHAKVRRAREKGASIGIPFTRAEIYLRDGGVCQYCLNPVGEKEWHMDHVIPLARGGAHKRSNVVVACVRCNLTKNRRTPKEAGMKLRRVVK